MEPLRTDTLEILTCRAGALTVGIDAHEVIRVISLSAADRKEVRQAMLAPEKKQTLYTLPRLFGELGEGADEIDQLIVLKGAENGLVLGVPGNVDVLTIPFGKLLVLPPYLRKRQRPLFTWGFFREAPQRFFTLITFARFGKESD